MGIDKINILFTAEEIDAKVAEIAEIISADYLDKDLLVLGILNGSTIFLADLVRKLTIPADFDFVAFSSYGNKTVSSGKVEILKDIQMDIKNKHVLIVEDIIDTGFTLGISQIGANLLSKGADSVKICTLINKPFRREFQIKIDYCGFEIKDEFVFGYGMDYKYKYRSLPYLGYFECCNCSEL